MEPMDIFEAVKTFGFAALCYFLAFWELREQRHEFMNLLKSEQEAHDKESKDFTAAIQKVAVVLEKNLEVVRLDDQS